MEKIRVRIRVRVGVRVRVKVQVGRRVRDRVGALQCHVQAINQHPDKRNPFGQ